MKCCLCAAESEPKSIVFIKAKICSECAYQHCISVGHKDISADEITYIEFEGVEYTPVEWQRFLNLKAFL